HVKFTVTSVLFQPFALAEGDRLPEMVGAALSNMIVTEPLPTLPRRSVAEAVLVTPAVLPLWLSVPGVGPLTTPEPASVALQVMLTLELFHPAALAAGVRAAATTGPVLSRVYEA